VHCSACASTEVFAPHIRLRLNLLCDGDVVRLLQSQCAAFAWLRHHAIDSCSCPSSSSRRGCHFSRAGRIAVLQDVS
jgi:hypothetical protein